MKIRAAIATIAFVGILGVQGDGSTDLKALCSRRNVNIKRISQALELIEALEALSNPRSCVGIAHSILYDLKPILSEGLDNACSLEKAEQIRQYQMDYIQPGFLPRSLKNFFVAFALKIDANCKKTTITELQDEAKQNFQETDFATMRALVDSQDQILSKVLPNSRFDLDDLLVAIDLTQSASQDNASDQKIYVNLANPIRDQVRSIQKICSQRFEPIYKQVIKPRVALKSSGFDYRGEDMEREIMEQRENVEVRQWYKITYLCDSLKQVVVVVDQPEFSGDSQTIKIYSEEEVNSLGLKKNIANRLNLDQIDVVHKTTANPLEDEVLPSDDKHFKKLINKYDSINRATDSIRSKVAKKMGKFVRDTLRRGEIDFVQGKKSKKEMVESMESFVSQINKFKTNSAKSSRPLQSFLVFGVPTIMAFRV